MSSGRVLRVLLVLSPALAFAVVGGWFVVEHLGPEPAPPADAGRLVVVAVFDQMRGDYLDRWSRLYDPDGFEKLKRDGVWYADAHLPYACAATGPGHASIATGVPPSVHGIVENEWYDRAASRVINCATAERYERVPLNLDAGPRSGGLSPDRLLAETVGDALRKATRGRGRVFSLAL